MNYNGEVVSTTSPDLAGNVTVGGDLKVEGVLKLEDGSDSAPSLTFIAETTTGLTRSGTGEVSFVASGAKRLKVAPTTTQIYSGVLTLGTDAEIQSVITNDSGTLTFDVDDDTKLVITSDETFIDTDLAIFGSTTVEDILDVRGDTILEGDVSVVGELSVQPFQPELQMHLSGFVFAANTAPVTETSIAFTTTDISDGGTSITYNTSSHAFTVNSGTYFITTSFNWTYASSQAAAYMAQRVMVNGVQLDRGVTPGNNGPAGLDSTWSPTSNTTSIIRVTTPVSVTVDALNGGSVSRTIDKGTIRIYKVY